MASLPFSAVVDGPQPICRRVEAHLASAEARDLYFTTVPTAVLRELLRMADRPRRDEREAAP